MGRKGKWFSSVKKALSPDSKEKKELKAKKKWFQKEKDLVSDSASLQNVTAHPPPHPQPVEENLPEVVNVENKHAYSATADSASTADVSVDVAPAPVPAPLVTQVVRSSMVSRFAGKSKEEAAAMRIQTAFRGYLARRALRALRGLVRLKSLMEGPVVKRQAASTLKCMQTLSRVQAQIRSRRIRMSEENQARQKQLLQKHAKEIATLQTGDDWNDSVQSKEKVEASLLSRFEASMRRERALAYAHSHQQTWKNSTRYVNPMFMDPSNPTWGWSWLERWMAARPWESNTTTEKELNDNSSVKSVARSINGGEISKSYIRHQLNSATPNSPTARNKPNSAKTLLSPSTPITFARKLKISSPRSNQRVGPDDDTKSMASVQSSRRHTIAGSTVRDGDSLSSSPSLLPSYMIPTESAKARLKSQSPLAPEENGTPEKGSVASAKKRLSYPHSPARPRRLSAPPKVGTSLNAEITVSSGSGS